jgi:hypothetical protein
MTKRIGRIAAVGLAAASALGAPAALAAGALAGTARVEATDLATNTVTLDGRIFEVVASTELADAAGQRLGLAELAVAERAFGAWVVSGDSTVRFEAVEGRGGRPVLTSLRVLGSVPR